MYREACGGPQKASQKLLQRAHEGLRGPVAGREGKTADLAGPWWASKIRFTVGVLKNAVGPQGEPTKLGNNA